MRASRLKFAEGGGGFSLVRSRFGHKRFGRGRDSSSVWVFVVFATMILMAGVIGPMLGQADAESSEKYWLYTINQDGTISGDYKAIGPGYAADRGQYVSSKGYNCGSWGFDSESGYGPFDSFYAAFDPAQDNKMICHLDPNNLKVSVDGKTDITGKGYNVMWCLPTVYWKTEGTSLVLTNDPEAGGIAYAHTVEDSSGKETVYPYLAIGVYEASSKEVNGQTILTSESGKDILTNVMREKFREYAGNQAVDTDSRMRIDGKSGHAMLWNFYQYELYKYCALAVMGGWDSQSIAGNGCTNDTSGNAPGLLDISGPYAGTIGSNSCKDSVKVFVENVWGSFNEFVDGIVFINKQYYVSQAAKPFDVSASSSSYSSSPPSGYSKIEGVSLPSDNGWGSSPSAIAETWGMPTGNSGSATTGLYDYVWASSSVVNLFVGQSSNPNSQGFHGGGLSYVDASCALSQTATTIGGRLSFVFVADPVMAVEYDHSGLKSLLDEFGYSESYMSGLPTGTTVTRNGTYDQLPDVLGENGFRHVGWIIDGKEYSATHRFVKMTPHTAKSVWVGLPAVTYDHSELIALSQDQSSEAGLSHGLEIRGHDSYEQLPPRNGYAHYGWRIEFEGKKYEVGPTDPFVTKNSHTAISLWTPVPMVTFDHSNLTSIVGTAAEGVSDLEAGMRIEGHSNYPQLPDTAGYKHIGWEVNGKTVGPTAALESQETHVAKSIWEKIPDSARPIPIIPDDEGDSIEVIIEKESEPWLGKNGKSLLIIAIIVAIIAELAVLTISRRR